MCGARTEVDQVEDGAERLLRREAVGAVLLGVVNQERGAVLGVGWGTVPAALSARARCRMQVAWGRRRKKRSGDARNGAAWSSAAYLVARTRQHELARAELLADVLGADALGAQLGHETRLPPGEEQE